MIVYKQTIKELYFILHEEFRLRQSPTEHNHTTQPNVGHRAAECPNVPLHTIL